MSTISKSEQIALLLNLLGDDATSTALAGMDSGTSREIKSALDDFESHPPTQEEIDFVLDDFEKYFRFAMETLSVAEAQTPETQVPEEPEPEPDILPMVSEPVEKTSNQFPEIELSGDAIKDLCRLDPYQISHALRDESPTAVAIVVRSLPTERAAKVLEQLPDAVRSTVFLMLAQPSATTIKIQDCVLQATLECALQVKERLPDNDIAAQMVTLIRSLPKNVRLPMLEQLMSQDEELHAKVKSQMYQFDDINQLGDRDIQKVLGQTSSDSLVVALQEADPELVERILKNMSKRARETLQEEMEFKTNVKQDEIDEGRDAIVKVLVELDEAGEISLD